MFVDTRFRLTPSRPWHTRLSEAAQTVWQRLSQRLRSQPLSRRDHFLSRASSHADLERRMREWSDFEQQPWLPPR
jgi:hypothetical protein